MMAGIEEDARQAIREIQEESPGRSRLSETTRRRLMKAGVIAAGTAGYAMPALRSVSLASSACLSPGLPQLSKTITAQWSENRWQITGVITLLNAGCVGLSISNVLDQLINLPQGTSQSTFFGDAKDCETKIASGSIIDPGKCADVTYTIFLSGFESGTVTNHAIVEYTFVGSTERRSVEAFQPITLSK
jgi:hypothetical protein